MNKQRRTAEFKVRAFELYKLRGVDKEEAFEQACREHGTTTSGCMKRPNCHSYMSEDIEGWIRERLRRGDTKVRELMEAAGFEVVERIK